VDPETGETNLYRVYSGGDAVRGPATVIEAVADGRRAAFAILKKLGLALPDLSAIASPQGYLELKRKKAQKVMPFGPETLPPRKRANFSVVELPFDPEKARLEAERCLQCQTLCDKCVEVCPNRANLPYLVRTGTFKVPILALEEGKPKIVATEELRITQGRQILHLDDLCNDCGNCATFCVHEGKPYQEKPRLFFDPESYAQEERNAFFLKDGELRRREDGKEMALRRTPQGFLFSDEEVEVTLGQDFSVQGIVLKRPFSGRKSLRYALEMALILEGISRSLPGLLEVCRG